MRELRHYFKRLYSYTGTIFYINLFGLVLVSLLDGISILLLIPLLSATNVLPMTESGVLSSVMNVLTNSPISIGLPYLLGLYILMVFGQNVLQRNLSIREVKIHQGFINQLKEEIYQGLLQVRWEFFLKHRQSNLINSLTKDIQRVGMGIKVFLLLLTNVVFTIIQIGIAFWISFSISSVVLLCGGCLALFSWRFVKQAKNLGKESTQLSRLYLAGITENLNGIKDIKTNNLEISQVGWLQNLNKRMLGEQVKYTELQTSSQLVYKTALAMIIASFIFLSVEFFMTQPAELLIVIVLFSRLWPRFVNIQSNLQQFSLTIPAFKVLFLLQVEIKEFMDPSPGVEDGNTFKLEKKIECRNVSYRYNKDESSFALKDVSLMIPAKGMTAIMGHSGAGKSTLVDLLTGLIQPESGEIVIDGVPLSNSQSLSLRRSVGFVPQDPFLFNTTIRNNLRLMKPNATEQEMWEALTFAAADTFVQRLPEGLDTRVGDRAVRLSGGERQRIVLARAILRKPEVLILDEATSALDMENERYIKEAIEKLKGITTVIIIAHRLSTIENADQVISLEKGRVIQGERSKEAFVHEGNEVNEEPGKKLAFNI